MTYLGEPEAGLAALREGLAGAPEAAGHSFTLLRGYVNLADGLGVHGQPEEAVDVAEAGMAGGGARRLRAHAGRLAGLQPRSSR